MSGNSCMPGLPAQNALEVTVTSCPQGKYRHSTRFRVQGMTAQGTGCSRLTLASQSLGAAQHAVQISYTSSSRNFRQAKAHQGHAGPLWTSTGTLGVQGSGSTPVLRASAWTAAVGDGTMLYICWVHAVLSVLVQPSEA